MQETINHSYILSMERKERLDLLRKVLAGDDISAMIIPSTDPHFGEYIPDHYKVLEWLSGFTGEAATLVVTQKEAALWVDSRFFIQAAAQLEGSGIEMLRTGSRPVWRRMT